MPAPDAIKILCENFTVHREHYASTDYNETELRREFLAPLSKLSVNTKTDADAAYQLRRYA